MRGRTLTASAGKACARRALAGAIIGGAALAGGAAPTLAQSSPSGEPIRVGFLWHMHQPIYVPYLDPFGADPFFSFSVPDVHNMRFGPYTSWPVNAINAGSGLPHLGASVSFSGSLVENLDALEGAGVNGGMWNNWKGAYRGAQSNTTALGNPRLDLVAFGYHHPLMPLLSEREIRMQVRLHKLAYGNAWNTTYARGMFPPETAFSTRMIPALEAEGIEWVLVDNIHFDRACVNYPHTNASNLFPPNPADQLNPDPAANGGRWVQLNNLWAPSLVSAPFGYQPHYVQRIDPGADASNIQPGDISRIVAVPAARYEGNEDGRGGYGAFLYDQVMDAYLQDNTDPERPMLVVLHHDGDNFGGGSEGYYNFNFQNMVNWDAGDPDYEVSTINDYLDRFPVPNDAVIHVEDGSWAGADNGDPEFKKWLGDPNTQGISPDINSWAVLMAARNHVETLEQLDAVDLDSASEMTSVLNGTGDPIHRAWHWLLVSQASDYWYWDGTEVWDSNVTRGANEAIGIVENQLATAFFQDTTAPSVFVPQREPYNPGGLEWNTTPEPSDFEVWTLAYDRAGIAGATLKWRTDNDGTNPLDDFQNETYAGGPGVSAWNSEPMTASPVPTPAGVLPAVAKADRYTGSINGQENVLIDYYVEVTDTAGNIAKSPIMHVWVGDGSTGGPGGGGVTVSPDPLVAGQAATVEYDPSGGPLNGQSNIFMHFGFNGWATVMPDVQMTDPDADGVYSATINLPLDATQLNFVFNNGAGTWDNNNGQDWAVSVTGGEPVDGFEIDGQLDSEAQIVASAAGITLWAALIDTTLYLATEPAGAGQDKFLAVAGTPGPMVPAMWAKGGQVALWDAFVGNESSNNYNGWFDQSGSAQVASGAVLEATIELTGELGGGSGAMPDTVAVAALGFGDADGAPLLRQAPASTDGDRNVEANEYLVLTLCELDNSCCPADLAAPIGSLDFFDVLEYLARFDAQDPAADLAAPLGSLDFFDVLEYLALFDQGC